MRDSRTRQLQKGRGAPASGSKKGTVEEAGSKRLAKLAKSVGNDAIRNRLHTGNSGRDAMLQHLVERLTVMRELQKREVTLMAKDRAQFPWWADVSNRHMSDVTRPNPTRWRESAQLYEEAAYHLVRGDLKRGQQTMKRAIAEEEQTRSQLTELVDTLDVEESKHDNARIIEETTGPPHAEPCEMPGQVQKLVDEIVGFTGEFRNLPTRKRRRDPWWTLEEEEEEEEEGGGHAGGG